MGVTAEARDRRVDEKRKSDVTPSLRDDPTYLSFVRLLESRSSMVV